MAIEYRGDEFLYLVEIEGDEGKKVVRPFNQTEGSNTIDSGDIELETKDKTGSDYGSVTESISLGGVFTEGDPAIPYIEKSIRGKKFVKILRVNTRDLSTEEGHYKIDNVEKSNTQGEFSEYSIDATLNGSIRESELTEVPEGAGDIEDEDNDDGNGENDSGN